MNDILRKTLVDNINKWGEDEKERKRQRENKPSTPPPRQPEPPPPNAPPQNPNPGNNEPPKDLKDPSKIAQDVVKDSALLDMMKEIKPKDEGKIGKLEGIEDPESEVNYTKYLMIGGGALLLILLLKSGKNGKSGNSGKSDD